MTPDSLPAFTRPLAPRLGIAAAVLAVAHVVAVTLFFGGHLDCDYWQIALFDLDAEEGLGTWLSAVILLVAGQLLLDQARWEQARKGPLARHWQVLGLGFHLLSLDEVAGLHEYLNTSLGDTSWTGVGAVGAGLVFVAFVPFLRRLEPRARAQFLIAGFVYLGGALGVERATDGYADADQLNSLAYNLWNVVEEGMEMGGIIGFIHALQSYRERTGVTAA